jgi:3-keto-disaccharide hydrolase
MNQNRLTLATKTRRHEENWFRFVTSWLRGHAMKQLVAAGVVASTLAAQTAPTPAQGRGRGGGPSRPEPLAMGDHTGFTAIFDGVSMKGWDGDPAFWRVADGALKGQSSAENPVKQNTFLIWRGGAPGDFELKVEYRISSTNSGIQFRSVQLPADADTGKWVMKGYQADIDAENQYTGQIYEERGRGFLAMRGQATFIPDGGRPKVVGNLQQTPDELKALIKVSDWNQVHLIARGSTIVQILNGAVTSVVVDEDLKNRQLGGLLGFQMHVGAPMSVEFRNIWLKPL